MDLKFFEKTAADVRVGVIKAVSAAGSGHPGGSLSAADIVTALYFKEMNIDPDDPKKKDRDKFILSKGHAGPVQYAALALRGFFPKENVLELRKLGGKFQGHPDMNKVPGVDMSTGSLGQGFSAACGMAMGSKLDNAPWNVYAILGDGEIQEGIVWEATMSAAHYKLDNLIVFLDYNGLQIDGNIESVMNVNPIEGKFKSFGWNVITIDGHDYDQIFAALDIAKDTVGKPTIIIAKTIKGKGVSFMENQASWHGSALNDAELKQALLDLGGACRE